MVKQLQQHNAAFCFIDTAPSRTDETAALFHLADLVIVPIRPSPSDLWAAATIKLLKREKAPFLFVLNQAKANAGITGQAAASLFPPWPGRGNLYWRPSTVRRRDDGRAHGQ